MKAKYNGRCAGCGAAIPAGLDVYYEREVGTLHWECRENPRPTPEAFALASQLGFLDHEAARVTDWPMRHNYEILARKAKDDGPESGEVA